MDPKSVLLGLREKSVGLSKAQTRIPWREIIIPHMRFEIGEFLEELSVLERIILRQLMEDRNPEGNINFGVNLKKLIREGIQSLQRKAENFYGRDYICSLLVMD